MQLVTMHCDPTHQHYDMFGDGSTAGLAASYGHYSCLAFALQAGFCLDRRLINFCARESTCSMLCIPACACMHAGDERLA